MKRNDPQDTELSAVGTRTAGDPAGAPGGSPAMQAHATGFSRLPPLALYVHLPWCLRKCPYCDFNSHTAGAAPPRARYVAALVADLRREAAFADGRPIDSVFLGGGTPSLFAASEIGEVLAAVAASCRLGAGAEITMEANPGALECDRLADYRAAGVNRLSLGAQSFDANMLLRLGRVHGPGEIFAAFDEALRAGFSRINLDLMYALPGQTAGMAVADIEQAVQLSPPHISWYQLALEPNTVFHARPPADLPDDDVCEAIERECLSRLAAAGYERYETSAFARPGQRCRHNLNYWQFGDYLAIGAGAHGKLTAGDGTVWRYRKPQNPRAYMEAIEAGGEAERTRLAPADVAFEYMLNVLRLPDGFAEDDFRLRTGLPFAVLAEPMARARVCGLIEPCGPGRWRPSELGRRFQNDLQGLFLPRRQLAASG